MRKFIYRLFFTRDDDMDLLQFMFLVLIVFFMVSFAFVGMGVWTIPAEAWTIFKWVFTVLAVTGVPSWLAVILAKTFGGGAVTEITKTVIDKTTIETPPVKPEPETES